MQKILIVEDQHVLAAQLAAYLSTEKFQVLIAEDGEQGLERARLMEPDLIVLDLMLPMLDGLNLCRIIRNEENTKEALILIVSARGTDIDKIVALENGADDYMVKPVSPGEFLSRVRALLRRKRHKVVEMSVLTSGDIQIHLAARQVFQGEKKIALSKKEFDLLVELVRNRGMVLSRDLILTKVWGSDYYIDKRTVDVHIRWLREKLEEDPSDPRLIVTIRGLGYRFEG